MGVHDAGVKDDPLVVAVKGLVKSEVERATKEADRARFDPYFQYEPNGLTAGAAQAIADKIRDYLMRPSLIHGTSLRIPFMPLPNQPYGDYRPFGEVEVRIR